jgi:hypothetical protein
MTCVDRVALDLFAVSDVINIRLLQVLAFGKKAASATPPFKLRNRKSYHITKWVATAQWRADGKDKELPPDDEHPSSRWRSKLNGEFRKEPCAEISHSFAEPGMAVMFRKVSQWTSSSHRLMLNLSITCACFLFVHRISAPQAARTRYYFMARFASPNNGHGKMIIGTRFLLHWRTGVPP